MKIYHFYVLAISLFFTMASHANRDFVGYACKGDIQKVEQELPDVDPNRRSIIENSTALECAIKNANLALVKVLLADNRVSVNTQDAFGKTPLIEAVRLAYRESHYLVTKELLKRKEIQIDHRDDLTGMNALMYSIGDSASKRNNSATELLLNDERTDYNLGNKKDKKTPLMYAAASSNTKVVSMLLSKPKIKVNSLDRDGKNALIAAIPGGYPKSMVLDTVRILVERGEIDVTVNSLFEGTALKVAIKWENFDVAQYLVNLNKIRINDKDEMGRTALHEAVNNSASYNFMDLILNVNGIDVNAADNYGWTPLHLAMSQSAKAVQALLDQEEIEPNQVDNMDRTPLYELVDQPRAYVKQDIAAVLLADPRVDLSIHPPLNLSLLDQAIDRNNTEFLSLYLSLRPSEPGFINKMLAKGVQSVSLDIVSLALEQPGIDVNAPFKGKTPLQYAREIPVSYVDRGKIISALVRAGAV